MADPEHTRKLLVKAKEYIHHNLTKGITLKAVANHVHLKLEYFHDALWNFFKWFHGFSAVNFCPSEETLKTLKSKGIENLKIWSKGIEMEKFNPLHRDELLRLSRGDEKRKNFLYVGRLVAEKDLDIFMQSIDKINRIHPGKARFVLVGDGLHTKSLMHMATENVLFPGYLKGRELAAMYASCDAFVFPSSTETFGNVVLEAMASDLPVITVDSGGVKESITTMEYCASPETRKASRWQLKELLTDE